MMPDSLDSMHGDSSSHAHILHLCRLQVVCVKNAELMSLWKMVPIAMGLIVPPSFLAMGISLAPKKNSLRCSGMNSYDWHFLHSLQKALTASEFICLMMSALHHGASTLFSFTFLTDHLKSAEVKGA